MEPRRRSRPPPGRWRWSRRSPAGPTPARAMNRRTASNWVSAAASRSRRPRGRFSRSISDRRLRSGGAGRPGTGYSCSPRHAQRDAGRDERSDRFGQRRSSSATSGPAATTCSKLSRTSSTVPRADVIGEQVDGGAGLAVGEPERPGDGRRDEGRIAHGIEGDEPHAVGEVARRPPPRPGATAASCRCRPVRSGSGAGSSAAARPPRPARARARRTRSAGSAGCSVARRASAAAGRSSGSPSMTSWLRRSGSRRSLSRCAPRSRRPTPSRRSSATSDRVASLSRTWPPWAAAAMRAVRLMS